MTDHEDDPQAEFGCSPYPRGPVAVEIDETDDQLLADDIARVLGEELGWDWEAVPAERIPSSSHTLRDIADALVERLRLTRLSQAPEWEYGVANFGDTNDVMQKPETITDTTDREWAEGAIQREYGDLIVRRAKAGAWSPAQPIRAGEPDEGER